MLPYKRPYLILKDELLVIRKYINEHLNKGFICPSMLPAAAPILLAKKLEKVFNFTLTIEDITLLRLKTNTWYCLYVRPLSGLIKLKSILSLILSPPLTIFKYGKVTIENRIRIAL